MGRKKSTKKNRISGDVYVTPMWCVDGLVKAIKESLPTPDWVVDLGAGDGRIGLAVVKNRTFIQSDKWEWVPRPCLLSVESNVSCWKELICQKPYRQDKFFPQPLEGCRGLVDELTGKSCVLYVSNPPFSLAFEWVEKAVHQVKTVHSSGSAAIFLLRADWLATKKRSEFVERYPPDRIGYLVPRPSFTGGGTDMREYCWYWWEHRPYRGTEIEVMRKR